MALGAVLVDQARILEKTATGSRKQGRTNLEAIPSAWFKARLFLPGSDEMPDAQGARRRQVKKPTMLVGKRDAEKQFIDIHAEHRIEIISRELGTATWRVQGDPEPLRKKRSLVGFLVTLERVKEPTREEITT